MKRKLEIEALEDRFLATASLNRAVLNRLVELQHIYYIPPSFQIPNLANQSVVLKDSSGAPLGTLVIQTENSDGTFTGTFNDHQIDRGATITPFGINFTANWSDPNALDDPMLGLPLDLVHHVDYSGSLYRSVAGYTTSGTMNQDTYFGYTDGGVTTFVNIFGGHHWVSTPVHGDFV